MPVEISDTVEWVPYEAPRASKRKRAEAVCLHCHGKKIKCDLQSKLSKGNSRCTNCALADQKCEERASKRGKNRDSSHARDVANSPVAETAFPETVYLDTTSHRPSITSSTGVGESSITISAPMEVDLGVGDVSLPPGSALLHSAVPPSGQMRSELPVSAQMNTPPSEGAAQSHVGDIDVGYLRVYDVEISAEKEQMKTTPASAKPQSFRSDLEETFASTYFEHCYAFCPVLDRDTLEKELQESSLLSNALALAATHIRPPLVPHTEPAELYKRARTAFYNDEETDHLTALKSLCLFYWWAPRSTSVVHRHSSWWWTSVIIRNAQQANVHRHPSSDHPNLQRLNLGLRRRIWWTAFAREKLTALCQSKPAIIDPDDCTILPPQPEDFPSDPDSQRKGRVFLYWTRICAIMGRMAKRLQRPSATSTLEMHLELVDWVQSLPSDLKLPIGTARIPHFDRDVHQLHLPYLVAIIILNLRRSARDVPQALTPAILAASCIARIYRNILSRGDARFLMAISCWYTGTAFIPLLQATKMPELAFYAEEELDILQSTVTELKKMWASADVIKGGIERLRQNNAGAVSQNRVTSRDVSDDFDWKELFPFVTMETGGIAACLLNDDANGHVTRGFPSPVNMAFYEDMQNQYNWFLEPWTTTEFDFSDVGLGGSEYNQMS